MRFDKYMMQGMTFAEASAARRADRERNAAANAAKREARKAAVRTCQICEREILANTGVIAHHGYQRPGNGWQTSSCFGARYRPYEVACDALPLAIKSLAEYVRGQKRHHINLVNAPPPGFAVPRHGEGPMGYRVSTVSVLRPTDFNARKAQPTYKSGDYVTLWLSDRHETIRDIAHANYDLRRLRRRLADWRAP